MGGRFRAIHDFSWRCNLTPSRNVNLKKLVIDLSRNVVHMTYTTRILNMNEHYKCEGQKQGTEQYLPSLYS